MSTRRRTPALLLLVTALTGACGGRVSDPEDALGRAARRVAPPAEAELAPPPRRTPPAPAAGLTPAEGDGPDTRWALLVGVNDYPGTDNDLQSGVSDARTTARALRAMGFLDDHVRVITEGAATGRAIVDGLRWLASVTRPGHTGVFLFAGHARQVRGDPDGDGEPEDEVLVGTEFQEVTDGAVAAALRPARGHLWLVFATCNAAGFDDAAAPGRVLTFASGEERLAYESPDLRSSFLVEFMVERAMLKRGLSSPEAAFRRARQQMMDGYRKFLPQQLDLHPGVLALVTRPAQAGV